MELQGVSGRLHVLAVPCVVQLNLPARTVDVSVEFLGPEIFLHTAVKSQHNRSVVIHVDGAVVWVARSLGMNAFNTGYHWLVRLWFV